MMIYFCQKLRAGITICHDHKFNSYQPANSPDQDPIFQSFSDRRNHLILLIQVIRLEFGQSGDKKGDWPISIRFGIETSLVSGQGNSEA